MEKYIDVVKMEDDYEDQNGARPRSEASESPVTAALDVYFSTTEETFRDSSYVEETQFKPYNPDELVQRNGDYSIYDDMLKDDQVSVALQLKKDLVIGSGFDFITEKSDEISIEIKECLEKAIYEDCESQFDSSLEEMLTAYENGFSISEPVFKVNQDGKLTLKSLKTRYPQSWLIHTDVYGNVEKFEQRTSSTNIFIDPKKLIHYVNNAKFQNPYGVSDLRSAYAAYFVKRQIVKYYAIFLEKAASPTPVAKYDKNAPQSAVDDIFNAIKRLQTKTALAIPKDIDIEFLDAKNNGDVFRYAIGLFNMFIGRSLFVPDLLGFQGSETGGGSYSLGQEQIGILYKHIAKRRQKLEKIINDKIIKPIVIYNYGFVDHYPKFKLRPIKDEYIVELAKTWLEGAKAKVFQPNDEEINHFRKLMKFPEGDVQKSGMVPEEILPENPILPMPAIDSEEPEMPEEELESEENGDYNNPKTVQEMCDEMNGYYKDPEKIKVFVRKKLTEYEKKVNFTKIKSSMDAFTDGVTESARPIIKKIFSDVREQLKKKRILETRNLDKIDSVKFKFKPQLVKLFNSSFKDAFKEAQVMAENEIDKGNDNSLVKKKFTPALPDDEFLELLGSETWMYIGDWEYNTKKQLRIALAAAIKDGKPLSEVIDSLVDEAGIELSEVSIERYARTKFTEVMNRGRREYFESTGVVAAYQFSAIMDDVTTEICAGLDGKIFEKGDEPIPPLHFNCRSLLVPITKYEEYEPDSKVGSKDIDTFIEDNIGVGFSRQ